MKQREKPAERLRKETPAEVTKKIETALHDIKTGNTAHFVTFSTEEFERFSRSLVKK